MNCLVSEWWSSAPGSFQLAPYEAAKAINELFQDSVGFYCMQSFTIDVFILHKIGSSEEKLLGRFVCRSFNLVLFTGRREK